MPTWAQVGHALWVDLHFERDFFICKPSKDLEGMRPIQASYCDRMRLGRLVLQGLLQEEPGGRRYRSASRHGRRRFGRSIPRAPRLCRRRQRLAHPLK